MGWAWWRTAAGTDGIRTATVVLVLADIQMLISACAASVSKLMLEHKIKACEAELIAYEYASN